MMVKTLKGFKLLKYVLDLPMVSLAFLLTLLCWGHQEAHFWSSALFLFFATLLWYIIGSLTHLYRDRRSNKFAEEIVFILYTLVVFLFALSALAFYFRYSLPLNARFLGGMTAFLFVLVTIQKYLLRKMVHAAIFHGKLYENLLIVGATPSARHFYDTIKQYYYYGYKCVGYLDDKAVALNGCAYKGRVKGLSAVLAQQQVDEVVIALPDHDHETIRDCVDVCDQYRTKARIIPDMQHLGSAAATVNNIGLQPVISIRELPLDKWENQLLKRIFDVFFAACFFLFVGSWLMPLIALLIKLTSGGGVIFKQERWGVNNKKIICYKFRTMKAGATEVNARGEYQQATKDDPRVTHFGKLLRKTNMDELPQFWNVLLGSMSVVGPRPHPTQLNLDSMHTVDNYMLRHIVRPGITGWAQVNGCRGETRRAGAMQQRVDYDLYYIHRWTFWFDCQIILQTVINILRGDQNAY